MEVRDSCVLVDTIAVVDAFDLACKQAIQRPGAEDMEIMPNERYLSFQVRTLDKVVSS